MLVKFCKAANIMDVSPMNSRLSDDGKVSLLAKNMGCSSTPLVFVLGTSFRADGNTAYDWFKGD